MCVRACLYVLVRVYTAETVNKNAISYFPCFNRISHVSHVMLIVFANCVCACVCARVCARARARARACVCVCVRVHFNVENSNIKFHRHDRNRPPPPPPPLAAVKNRRANHNTHIHHRPLMLIFHISEKLLIFCRFYMSYWACSRICCTINIGYHVGCARFLFASWNISRTSERSERVKYSNERIKTVCTSKDH